jgi:hypothetical protein
MNKERIMVTKLISALVLAVVILLPTRASAWDRTTDGTVLVVDLYPDGGFTFVLSGYPALCSGPPQTSWNANHGAVSTGNGISPDGVKAFLATVLAAKLAGRQVTVYADNNPTDPTAPCVVGSITIN